MRGGFALSMKSGGRQWGAAEIAPTEAGRTEEPAPADCCPYPFGGKGDTSCVWSGGCSCPSCQRWQGNEVTGAGIWVLMARVGAGLCRATYVPQAEHSDQAHPYVKLQVPGGWQGVYVPTWTQQEHTRSPDGCGHHPLWQHYFIQGPHSLVQNKTGSGGLGRWCCRKLGKWQGAGLALVEREMALSSSRGITEVSEPRVCGQDETRGGIREERR